MADDYDLELERVVKEIQKHKAKKILIQLGEGLKPRSMEIQEHIQKHTKDCEIHFWLNSCYGKCDIPEIIDNKNNDYDMLIQFGH
jgi:2-(3-amino-3-carboxypropyl)histidine synthase